MDTSQGLKSAIEKGLDLVEISPESNPPVCKIADYGKLRFELSKREAENRKKAKRVLLKEIKLGINISDNDYKVKLKHAQQMVEDEGNKVKIVLALKGRQNAHKDIAIAFFTKLKEDVLAFSKIDKDTAISGNQISIIIAPKL